MLALKLVDWEALKDYLDNLLDNLKNLLTRNILSLKAQNFQVKNSFHPFDSFFVLFK